MTLFSLVIYLQLALSGQTGDATDIKATETSTPKADSGVEPTKIPEKKIRTDPPK